MAEHRALEATHHDLSARSLEAELCAAFPDVAEEVRWLLGPANGDEVTYGRPQNYFLLRFAGRRLLMVDDDVVLDPRRPPLAKAGVELTVQPEAGFWYESHLPSARSRSLRGAPQVARAAAERSLGASAA
ncbi:MAG: hypothetical protein E6H55_06725 [Betaproteobacteria bacterium]|nr:MAG: hypothetical protein E6H55_06725 [Betaproteobacteria bacterium]